MNIRLLTESDIEVKISRVNQYGVGLLLYKTARVDMDILDETFGPMNWQSEYREIKGNLYCGIAVRDAEHQEWVWKWDCGIESRSDSDGNQKKGEASDAFKRAGFKVGIGRELYTSPDIFIKADKVQMNGNKCYDKFSVEKIAYDEDRRINGLAIRNDSTGKRVFLWQRT